MKKKKITFDKAIEERERFVSLINEPKNELIDIVVIPNDSFLSKEFKEMYNRIGREETEKFFSNKFKDFEVCIVKVGGLFYPLNTFLVAQAYGASQKPLTE